MTKTRLLIAAFGLIIFGVLGTAGPAAAAGGSISGTVTDSSHAGIGSIYVCAYSPDYPSPFSNVECEFTNGSGEYEIENLNPGQYAVEFRDESKSLNYVTEFYNDKASRADADLVTVGTGLTPGIDAELADGGQIQGTVTDSITHLPIEGIEVCAPNVVPGETTYCGRTDSTGKYTINSLATGSYKVEFFTEGHGPNYITQYYNGKAQFSEAEAVSVTAGAITPNVNAAMQEGIQVTGLLTEAGSGNPVKWVVVCALEVVTEVKKKCAASEPDGTYSIAGLPLGSYVISFAVDLKEDGVIVNEDGYVRQYYDHKASFAEANIIGGPAPGVFTNINAELVKGAEVWPFKPGPVIQQPFYKPGPKPLKCKKGQHKKKAKGKVRCVKTHRKHRRRHSGPRA